MGTLTNTLNRDAIAARIEQNEQSFSGSEFDFHKIAKGVNRFHILPPWPGNSTGVPWHEVAIHFFTDLTTLDSKGKPVSAPFACAASTEGRCVLCGASERLKSSIDPLQKKLGEDIRQQKKALYNAVDDKFVTKVLSVSPMIHGTKKFKGISHVLLTDMDYNMDPTSYTNGLMVTIIKEGDGLNTTYTVGHERNRVACPEAVIANHDKLTNLEQVYPVYTNAELTEVLNGNLDPKGLRKNIGKNASPLVPAAQTTTTLAQTPTNPVQAPTQPYTPPALPPQAPSAGSIDYTKMTPQERLAAAKAALGHVAGAGK